MTAPLEITVALDPKLIAEYVGTVVRDELGDLLEREPKLAYSIEEAARAISISPSTAYRMVKAGELPSIQIGGRKVVPVAMLAEWIAERVQRSAVRAVA